MNIIDVHFDSISNLVIQLNLLAVVIVAILIWLIAKLWQFIVSRISKHSVVIEEVSLGIGNSTITLKYDNKDREIAYKLWVELNTRKIGMLFDEENDVITEVYDSWYEYFKIARELIKDVPVSKIKNSSELIKLATDVLNLGLRPHLTKWQAKYRKWFSHETEQDVAKSPQEIQRQYPLYHELINDIFATNKKIIAYKDLMYKIAFGE